MLYRVMLVCALGYSTSMLAERIKKAARIQGLEFAVEAVSRDDLEEMEALEDVDVLLLGPQVKHLQKSCEDRYGLPVLVATAEAYGLMSGEKVLAEIVSAVKGRNL